ncbi:MAG: hypothetical protein P0Y64_16775 [Candidatus Sphingomonas colombiensis]|nr:hypothetical protein [Sphingomonas sp.]WEK42974.1 MAG: hypothetical protein P0Y64_16775 [Sphingomonas sp.]
MTITIQSAYLTDYQRGMPGMLADGATQNRISRTVEDAAGIAFGKAAFQGTTDHGLTGTPGTKFLGVVIADVGLITQVAASPDILPQYSTPSLLDMGDIFVTTSVAVTPGQPVFVTPGGAFTNVSTSNTAIPATFRETAAIGAPVRIRIVQQ